MDKYDCLKLENQLCFPLYACSRQIIKKYTPMLAESGLTYTQYITMMVLWNTDEINVKDLGEKLYLDSGTLTPVLKKLESKGLITRQRSIDDERNLSVKATEAGMKLRDELLYIPKDVGRCISLAPEEAAELYRLLYKVLQSEG